MGLIATLIIGGIVGWLASIAMKTNAQMGVIANVAVGIIGSWLGGQLAATLGLAVMGSAMSFLASILGAMILIWLLKMLGIFKKG